MMKKPKPMHRCTARLTGFALTGMVVFLSSADALPTIEFLGDVNDEARHSSMTNAAKWTKGISFTRGFTFTVR